MANKGLKKSIKAIAAQNTATSQEMLGISRDSLDFSKQQYADQMAEYQRLSPIYDQLAQGQISATALSNDITKQSWNDYNSTYRPLEQRVAADAATAGSDAEQQARAGQAGIDVQRQIDMQRGASDRNLTSMGVNPNSGKFASASRTASILGAAARAGAETQARERERLRGDAMRSSAVATGKGLTGTALTGVQVGGNAAAQASGLAGTNLNTSGAIGSNYLANRSGAAGMMGNAANVNAGAAGIYNNLYANNLQSQASSGAASAGMFGAIGNVAGSAIGAYFSDETLKTGKKKFSGKTARSAIDRMPVEKWKYKPGTQHTDAESGEGPDHIGPYAQDFARETGVGDGHTINVIDAIGVNMAATKELSRELKSMRRDMRGVAA